MTPTREQLKAGFGLLLSVSEAIRSARRIPSGALYAALMAKMDLPTYTAMVGTLVRTGLVAKTPASELIWVGPVDTADPNPHRWAARAPEEVASCS